MKITQDLPHNQSPSCYTSLKEGVQSTLGGLSILCIGLIMQQGQMFTGHSDTPEKFVAAFGIFVQSTGTIITGISQQQTLKTATPTLIAGIALLILRVLDEKKELCFTAGLSLTVAGSLALAIILSKKIESQQSFESQQALLEQGSF